MQTNVDPFGKCSVHYHQLVCAGLCVLVSAMHLTSLVTPSWAVMKDSRNGTTFAGFGLWKYCDKLPGENIACRSVSDSRVSPGSIQTAQAIFCTGFALVLLSTFASLVSVIRIRLQRAVSVERFTWSAFILFHVASVILHVSGVIHFGNGVSTMTITSPPPSDSNPSESFTTSQVDWSFILVSAATGVQLILIFIITVRHVLTPSTTTSPSTLTAPISSSSPTSGMENQFSPQAILKTLRFSFSFPGPLTMERSPSSSANLASDSNNNIVELTTEEAV